MLDLALQTRNEPCLFTLSSFSACSWLRFSRHHFDSPQLTSPFKNRYFNARHRCTLLIPSLQGALYISQDCFQTNHSINQSANVQLCCITYAINDSMNKTILFQVFTRTSQLKKLGQNCSERVLFYVLIGALCKMKSFSFYKVLHLGRFWSHCI